MRTEATWGSSMEFETDVVIEDLEEPDLSPNSLAILISIENERILSEAVNRLSERERLLIQGLYFQDRTARELAEVMDISLSVLKKNHKKALKNLKQIVDDDF